MSTLIHRFVLATATSIACFATPLLGQEPPPRDREGEAQPPREGQPMMPPPGGGGPGFGPGGPGGPGGFPGGEERKVLAKFDSNADGWLNAAERAEARKAMKEEDAQRPQGEGRRGRGGPPGGGGGPPGMGGGGGPGGGMGGGREPGTPGPKVSPEDVKNFPNAGLFDANVLRTIFLDFESEAWEEELEAFHNTDVEVPCTLTVDGKTLEGVGVSFRGASSYMMIPRGSKRSFNLTIDYINSSQLLHGEKTLNLLNSNGDPSFLSTILYSHIARKHLPAPRANLVKVVVNGESWGVFISVEQFNKDFLQENFGSDKGARWKVSGSPNGRSGLDYVGDDLAVYKQRYQIKSKDDKKDWEALIELCRTLTETPLAELEAALKPMLDIDSALWFLAIDNALVNTDGYWVRASDYNLYRDPDGVFHLIPHDMNESFAVIAGGPGGRRGGGGGGGGPPGGDRPRPPGDAPPAGAPGEQPERGQRPAPPGEGQPPNAPNAPNAPVRLSGVELDPLIGGNDAGKPLRSRLLAVPSLRAKYMDYVRQIASEDLAWQNIGPIVAAYRDLARDEVEADTRKLTSFAAFETATSDELPEYAEGQRPPRSLRMFADLRSKFLLNYKEKPAAAATPADSGANKGEQPR